MIRFCFTLILISLFSCHPESVTSSTALEDYVNDIDHGVKKVENVDDFRIEVSYRPQDLMIAHELENIKNETQLNVLKDKYRPYTYFVVKLSKNNREALQYFAKDRTVHSQLVQTMSFDMEKYVTLTTNLNDTLPVTNFILNRTYGLNASTDILFAFINDKSIKQEWMQFNLNEFGMGLGNIRFQFNLKDINKTPFIDFENLE